MVSAEKESWWMKTAPSKAARLAIAFASASAFGQGTFIYDQQSADETTGGGVGGLIQSFVSIGQSFTPTLSSVGFIRLRMFDSISGNGIGATVHLNLRSGSISGSILSSTDPVFMPDGFGVGNGNRDYPNFFFPRRCR